MSTFRLNRINELFMHIAGWSIMLVLPAFFTDPFYQTFSWSRYAWRLMLPASLLCIFYLNYCWLAVDYIKTRKLRRYILMNFLVIAVFLTLSYFLHTYLHQFRIVGLEKKRIGTFFFPLFRDFTSFAMIAALAFAILVNKSWHKTEQARKNAETARTQIELQNLRNQINPHFLLNTLNNIYALISFNHDKAQEAVLKLSEMLRCLLYENKAPYVPLRQEIQFLKNYTELMDIRLNAHVETSFEAESMPHSDTVIAPFIFISLIENAYKHGISPTQESFIHIRIQDDVAAQKIVLEIRNSNFPKDETDKSGHGIGLEQVKKRLELTYPNAHKWMTQIDKHEYRTLLTLYTTAL